MEHETQNLLISKWKELAYISHCLIQQPPEPERSSPGARPGTGSGGDDSMLSAGQTTPGSSHTPHPTPHILWVEVFLQTARSGFPGEGAFNPPRAAHTVPRLILGVGRMWSFGNDTLCRAEELWKRGWGGSKPFFPTGNHPSACASGAALTLSSPKSQPSLL